MTCSTLGQIGGNKHVVLVNVVKGLSSLSALLDFRVAPRYKERC